MARPDRIRNIQLRVLIDDIPPALFVRNTIPQASARTTIVRMAVARLESTPSIPILARIAVAAANTADRIANNNHIFF